MRCKECYVETENQEEMATETLCLECFKGLEEFAKDIQMDALKNGDFDA